MLSPVPNKRKEVEGEHSLLECLAGLSEYFDNPDITEIAINRPGEVWTESSAGWDACHVRHDVDFNYCKSLALSIATFNQQAISEAQPLLSGKLPNGERVQVVMPPACEADTIVIVIRKPSKLRLSFSDYVEQGSFENTTIDFDTDPKDQKGIRLSHEEKALWELLNARKFEDFFRYAVADVLCNTVVSGATGSGKTTVAKALSDFIPPEERVVTVEDASEMDLPRHPNHIHLFYTKGGQGVAKVTPQDQIANTLRIKPDRVLLAELRGDEIVDYLRMLNTGHPGSLTTIHSDSTWMTWYALLQLYIRTAAAATSNDAAILGDFYKMIDIVLHFKKVRKDGRSRRVCTGIFYDPFRKRRALRG